MSDFNRGYARPAAAPVADMAVDAGLRAFMLGVYNKVALGLVLSAAMAYVTSQVEPVRDILFRVTDDGRFAGFTIPGFVVAFAPLAVILFTRMSVRQSPQTASLVYWVVVALFGASMGELALVYTGASIATTFLITAVAFGSLSLVGYTTKKDLTAMGSFMIMALIGLILAMVVNMFLHSAMMELIVSALGVLIFAGLIAWNTQQLKMTYYQLGGNQAAMSVATSYGALSLYLDFINLFQFLLSFTGSRR